MTLEFYRPLPKEFEKHTNRCMPVPRGQPVSRAMARTDLTYFAVNMLNLKPYMWQAKAWDDVLRGKNVQVCSARQVGKTQWIAIFALWACMYNTMPMHIGKKTRVVLVSKSLDQSKKVISDVKEWMKICDEVVRQLTFKYDKEGNVVKKGIENFATDHINKDKQGASNTKSIITFKNGCEIISLPPTDSARGYTGSILFLDEAAFFDDEEIFEQTLRPIVSQTGNRVCMTSTPNGQQGFFYKHFDPEDTLQEHEFVRYWIPYTSLYLDSPELVSVRDARRETALAMGNERSFDQEHMASFNTAAASFFDVQDIDACVVKDKFMLDSYNKPCDLAVDFGKIVSRTVTTISALEGDHKNKTIRLLYQYEYPPSKDLSLIEDIENLMERFAVQRIIFEDCPASETFRQVAESKGWNLVMFNPSRDKAKKYFALKSWIRRKDVELLMIPELLTQMKGLQQEETPTRTKIHHGAGLLDDRVDSFMMSTIFFTEENKGFKFWDWDQV